MSIKDHRFSPAEIHAPANTAITLTVKNLDKTPEEFESKPLRVEKVIAGGDQTTVHINRSALAGTVSSATTTKPRRKAS